MDNIMTNQADIFLFNVLNIRMWVEEAVRMGISGRLLRSISPIRRAPSRRLAIGVMVLLGSPH